MYYIVYYYTRPIRSYAMLPVDHKLWSNVPPAPIISLSRREKIFFCQKVSSLSSLIALSISRRHLSSRLQQ